MNAEMVEEDMDGEAPPAAPKPALKQEPASAAAAPAQPSKAGSKGSAATKKAAAGAAGQRNIASFFKK
jgi:hypothetical protein